MSGWQFTPLGAGAQYPVNCLNETATLFLLPRIGTRVSLQKGVQLLPLIVGNPIGRHPTIVANLTESFKRQRDLTYYLDQFWGGRSDGRGRALDNVFCERLWRSVKYENIYLNQYGSVRQLRTGLTAYFDFYNHERPHQSLNYRTPAEEHFLLCSEPDTSV